MKLSLVLLLCLFGWCWMASASVILMGKNVTLSFPDIEANFAPAITGSGERGVLYVAEPLDACSDLTNTIGRTQNGSSTFVLTIRGHCEFEDKVRRAQKAGFRAAIVYDNQYDGALVAMAGSSAGISIYAVFISRAAGETLKRYAGLPDVFVWLIPSFENSAWSIMAISFISLLAMSAVLATCFFVRRHRIRRHPQDSRVREFHGMSRRLVKAMPSLIFTSVLEDNCTSATCAICLEDYSVGEKLRILPCGHKFHTFCVDSWLTCWRTFCPVCKRDARTSTGEPPASESTPLLSSSMDSIASSALSSFRSSMRSSSAIRIDPSSVRSSAIRIDPSSLRSSSAIPIGSGIRSSSSTSFSRSRANTLYIQQSPLVSSFYQQSPLVSSSFHRQSPLLSSPFHQQSPLVSSSFHQSPSMTVSRSAMDLRNGSPLRSHASHMVSPHSLGFPSVSSPLNRRSMSHYRHSPSNASPTLLSSSSNQFHPLRYSESAGTFSPYASGHSLPEC